MRLNAAQNAQRASGGPDKPDSKNSQKMRSDTVSPGTVVYNEKEKLTELQSMILKRGDMEYENALREARAEAEKWLGAQTKQLDAMVDVIKADAAKRSNEVTSRQLAEADSARDKDRLRLQNELIRKALAMFQNALVAFDQRVDYAAILAGAAVEACARLPEGKVKVRLRAEDASYGEAVLLALKRRYPQLDAAFDPEPAPILGGALFQSEDGQWRVVADWKTKVEDMADAVAKAVLAVL